jgi:hypothetical protein
MVRLISFGAEIKQPKVTFSSSSQRRQQQQQQQRQCATDREGIPQMYWMVSGGAGKTAHHGESGEDYGLRF